MGGPTLIDVWDLVSGWSLHCLAGDGFRGEHQHIEESEWKEWYNEITLTSRLSEDGSSSQMVVVFPLEMWLPDEEWPDNCSAEGENLDISGEDCEEVKHG